VLITRHWAHKLPISIGTFYGFAQGPTWPKARQLSDQLLETFTQELVFGMTGVRLIMGDFNQEPEQLDATGLEECPTHCRTTSSTSNPSNMQGL